MNQDWQLFLKQHGAQINNDIVNRFGAGAAECLATRDGTVLCALSQYGTLHVAGEEAQLFLQNLLSNDISEIGKNRAQLSSLNTAKGRMLASMLIWRDSDGYLLQLPRELCEPIRKKLSMYVLRSKVKISDASDEIITLGLSGADAQEILRKHFSDLPQQTLGVSQAGQTSILKIDETRFQINTTARDAPALWAALDQHAQSAGSACWDWLNIHAGIPFILPQTQEQFVPQMVNFDLIGGINFKKGCYPGQEIVARTQYLGKLKRRMYLARIDTPTHSAEFPQAGDELFSADMEGQASGVLVNVASSPVGGYDVLAVVQTASRETQMVHWKSLQGAALQFIPLPYSLPSS